MLVTFVVTSISIHNVGHVVNIMSMSADGLPRTLCQGMVMFCQGVSTSEVLQWSVPVSHLRSTSEVSCTTSEVSCWAL